jgi:hypothetical protein
MAQRGPGPVAAVHRVTIATAFVGALAYAAWELRRWAATGAAAAAARGVLALAVAAAIGWYLWHLRERLARRLTPGGGPEPR